MSRPRTRTREEILEYKRRYSAEYRRRNAEKIRAYKKSEHYRKLHREHNRKWLATNPGYMRQYRERVFGRKPEQTAREPGVQMFACRHCGAQFERAWCGRGKRPHTCPTCLRKHMREASSRWARRHADKIAAKKMREKVRLYLDAEAYARLRANQRERGRKFRDRLIAAGLMPPRKQNCGLYRPRHNIRYPDWCTKGQFCVDVRSAFLPENLTPAMRAYARELFRERRAQREGMAQ